LLYHSFFISNALLYGSTILRTKFLYFRSLKSISMVRLFLASVALASFISAFGQAEKPFARTFLCLSGGQNLSGFSGSSSQINRSSSLTAGALLFKSSWVKFEVGLGLTRSRFEETPSSTLDIGLPERVIFTSTVLDMPLILQFFPLAGRTAIQPVILHGPTLRVPFRSTWTERTSNKVETEQYRIGEPFWSIIAFRSGIGAVWQATPNHALAFSMQLTYSIFHHPDNPHRFGSTNNTQVALSWVFGRCGSKID